MAKKDRQIKKNKESRENNVLKSLAGSFEEALSEDISEFSDEDVIVVDVPDKPRRHNCIKGVYFALGLLVIILAAIGLVTAINGCAGMIGDIANQTALKNEFQLYLYPVVATDPPTFEESGSLANSTVIKAAISKILLTGDTSNYESDIGVLYIPEFDVESSAKAIFGSSIAIEHETVGYVEDLSSYIPEKKAYAISNPDRIANYYPVVTEISNVGETYTMTVEYYTPRVDIEGLDREYEADKTMTYVVTKSGDKRTITSLQFSGLGIDDVESKA